MLERLRQDEAYRELRDGGQLLRAPAPRKDVGTVSIAFAVGLPFDADRPLTGTAAVIRGDTRSGSEDRRMRRRPAELEAELAGGRATPAAVSASD